MYEIEEKINEFDMKLVGTGSYASVYKYKDSLYDCYFAIKKLKKSITGKEKERFKHEYELLSRYNYPNILKVYRYIETKSCYIMEYCDYTLKQYFEKRGNNIKEDERKDIALQFLNALKVLHDDGLLHRDISYNNVLVKQYDYNKVIIKISDFGLIKDQNFDLTSIQTSMKGTIIDDTLVSFNEFNLKNEIYSIGILLLYIFTGKQTLKDYGNNNKKLVNIIDKCIDRVHSKRYDAIDEIISDIKKMFEEKNANVSETNVRVNTKVVDKNKKINELAYEILERAAEDNGCIFYIKSLSGVTVQCGEKKYVPISAREEAELDNAIEVLEKYSYIKANNYKRDFFRVTKSGYDYLEK